MTSKLQTTGNNCLVALPPEVLVELGWGAGDELTIEILDGALKLTCAKSKHNEALRIARKGMQKYKASLEALAKS